jgi:Flp pilus assembly protein TadD
MRIIVVKAVLGLSVAVSLLALATPVAAQTGAFVQATPPAMAVERLNQNLTRLSRQPTDMEALIGAGMASYELGDAQAANGFFTRANMVNPRVGRVKLGLALVSVALKQAVEAATYFDEADALGEPGSAYATQRAQAYDLTGQQEKAQRNYVMALRADSGNAELIRSYAISLGISGHVDQAEAQLRPLLYKSDRAAWRDRTMILAMNGRTSEARKIAQTIMPRSLSDAMEPYLLRMGSLTPAQKAAATYYGQFPADGLRLATVTSPPTAQVTAKVDAAAARRSVRDRRKVVTSAPTTANAEDGTLLAAMPKGDTPPSAMVQPVPSPAPAAPSRANPGDDDPDVYVPEGRGKVASASVARVTPAGRRGASYPSSADAPAAPRGAAMVQPVVGSVPVVQQQVVQPRPYPAPVTVTPASPPQSSPPVMPAAAPQPVVRPVQGPMVNESPVPPVPAPASAPAPVTSVAAQPSMVPEATQPSAEPATPQPGFSTIPVAGPAATVAPRTLAAIMSEIKVTEDAERTTTVPAVDLDEIARLQAAKRKAAAEKAKKDAALKAKAEADAKAKAEARAAAEEAARLKANPARIWLQVATGRDPAALTFDMRRLRKTYSVLADQDASTAEWGATRRLLVGPFVSVTKAKALLTDLKKAGSDGFVWQSEVGEVVAPLSRK